MVESRDNNQPIRSSKYYGIIIMTVFNLYRFIHIRLSSSGIGPYLKGDIDKIILRRAARFVTNDYSRYSNLTAIPKKLNGSNLQNIKEIRGFSYSAKS
jgi:hypothetical protein